VPGEKAHDPGRHDLSTIINPRFIQQTINCSKSQPYMTLPLNREMPQLPTAKLQSNIFKISVNSDLE
jgi:hypothetical protein